MLTLENKDVETFLLETNISLEDFCVAALPMARLGRRQEPEDPLVRELNNTIQKLIALKANSASRDTVTVDGFVKYPFGRNIVSQETMDMPNKVHKMSPDSSASSVAPH
jgi:hypothetical protein